MGGRSAPHEPPRPAQYAISVISGSRRPRVVRAAVPIRSPDVTVGGGYRHFELGSGAAVVTASIPLPLFDRNRGAQTEARERISRAQDEQRSAIVRLANAGFYDDAPVAAVAPGLYVEATTRDGHAHDEPLPIEAIGNRNRPEPGALVLGRAGDEGDATRLLFVTGTASGAPFAGTHTVFGMAADGMTVIAGLRVGDVLKSVRVRQ